MASSIKGLHQLVGGSTVPVIRMLFGIKLKRPFVHHGYVQPSKGFNISLSLNISGNEIKC